MHSARSVLRSRALVFALVSGLAAALVGGALGSHGADSGPVPVEGPAAAGQCSNFDVPIGLQLSVDEGSVAPGASVEVLALVEVRGPLSAARLALAAEGPLELEGPSALDLGALDPGQPTEVRIPVRYTGEGRSVLRVDAFADSAESEQSFEKHEALYVILESGRATSGMAEFLNLDLRRLEEDLEEGLLSQEDAEKAARSLTMPPVEIDEEPRDFIPPTEEQEALSRGLEAVADPDDTFVPDDGPIIGSAPARGTSSFRVASASAPGALSAGPVRVASAGGSVTVQGTVNWLDENGATHAAFGVTVQVRDEELIGSELVAQQTTDANGQYSFVVNNDDGPLAGDRDLFVRFRTANSAVSIESAGILGAPYEADTAVQNEVPDGSTLTRNFTCANTGTGPSCGLLTGATYVAVYARNLNAGSFLSHIVLEWPGSAGSANYDGSDINLRPGDRWDWDVMFHEYGHYVQDTFDFENNPGGPHNLGDCISVVQGSKDAGIRLAWGEGWPTFFGTAGQQQLNLASLSVPRVGDVSYADTGESNFSYSLEAQDNLGLGEDNELAVQRILWDLFDAPADSRDTVQVTDQSLFDLFDAGGPTTFSGAWSQVRAPLSSAQDLAYGAITTDHRVGPNPQSPASSAIVGPGATFSWSADVGCNLASFGGDSFDLVFYDAATLAELLTLPGIATPSRVLAQAEYDTLVASTHSVRWAVEGRNGDSPATGPFLGDNRAVTLNRPPVANAGPDQLGLECTSPGGRSVQLNGAGSSDPDNDPLTYAWTAPGIAFDDPTSATPTGTFPLGTRTATLVVSDGIQSDDDTVDVQVVDSTPPVIVCPTNLLIECNAPGGVPATDPQIVAFLAGASATDTCDVAPVLANDAPGFFPLGATPVTFTATDASNNQASCIATVTVQDTTPPEIRARVEPTRVWPPNHKLVDIAATVTVTDICDPAPTFELTSVTSSEPDNGLGDGDTSQDVQGATFGTPDVAFQLRAERSGKGRGRTYSILYTAEDGSGNTTPAELAVEVPHSRKP